MTALVTGMTGDVALPGVADGIGTVGRAARADPYTVGWTADMAGKNARSTQRPWSDLSGCNGGSHAGVFKRRA